MKKIINQILDKSSKIYQIIKADFSYHSSAIEGSAVSEKDNLTLSKLPNNTSAKTIANKYKNKYDNDEVVENFNCSVLVDYVLDTLHKPFCEQELKIWHSILKKSTEWANHYTSSYGDYKKIT